MKNKKVSFIVTSAVVAALYVVLTYLAAAFGLASNVIQVRFSEALTILPIFTPAAIPGLFVGCIVANALTGAVIFDVIFGSIATLIGAIGAIILQGPHHVAQKSTSTGMSEFNTSFSKFSFVRVISAIFISPFDLYEIVCVYFLCFKRLR